MRFSGLLCGINGVAAPSPSKDACSQPHKAVMQGCIKTATQSRCTMQRHKWLSLHRCNGTNGCRCTDATAQMAVIAQTQRHKWLSLHRCNGTNGCQCTDATTLTVDDLYGGFAPPPRLVSTVCLTYKINYSIIRGKMQVKFSGENHGFLWQNVKFKRLIFEDKTIL